MDKKRGVSILVLIVIILIAFIFLFQNFKLLGKQPTTTTIPPIVDELCSKFEPVEGEVTCKEAALAALAENPGEPYDILKTTAYTGVENLEERGVWLFRIKLEETVTDPVKFPGVEKVGAIEIIVDRYNKEWVLTAYGPPLEEW